MRKIIASAVVAAFAGVAMAASDQAAYSVTVVNINTGTLAKVVNGEVGSVITVVPTGATGTMSLVCSDGTTLFSKSGMTAGTTVWPILVPAYSTAGAALVDRAGGDTNVYTNSVLTRAVVNGEVTLTVVTTGTGSGTNTYKAYINYLK